MAIYICLLITSFNLPIFIIKKRCFVAHFKLKNKPLIPPLFLPCEHHLEAFPDLYNLSPK